MLTCLLAEALAVTSDNLAMTAAILDCAEDVAKTLSPETQQRLNLVHTGLALALQAMDCEEIKTLIQSELQSEMTQSDPTFRYYPQD